MAKAFLAVACIAALIGAAVIDWRAAGLMVVAWWADNIMVKLMARDRG